MQSEIHWLCNAGFSRVYAENQWRKGICFQGPYTPGLLNSSPPRLWNNLQRLFNSKNKEQKINLYCFHEKSVTSRFCPMNIYNNTNKEILALKHNLTQKNTCLDKNSKDIILFLSDESHLSRFLIRIPLINCHYIWH